MPVSGDSLVIPGRKFVPVQAARPYAFQLFTPFPGAHSGGALFDSIRYRFSYPYWLWITSSLSDTTDVKAIPDQVRPFEFKHVYRLRGITTSEVVADSSGKGMTRQVRPRATSDPFGGMKLQRRGSITRGILAGNRRDVSVESGLRMELAGELVDGVQVQAVLTDENTPIQPDGTTQRISEFDRVAIQLQARHGKAELGDFDLVLTGSEFARFNRKLQGASLSSTLPAIAGTPFSGGSTTVAVATARGQYRLQEIQPLDGVQGPYRLEGAAGERFIIVLAGSETVYLDGQRLERGELHDYVVDYQTGEITFTPRRIISDDHRITVEFQYTTHEYTRTMVAVSSETNWWARSDGPARARLGVSFLREADSRRFSSELGFTAADSLLLSQAGDGLALRDGAEVVAGPFDPEAPFVQYTREPRVVGGVLDTVYVALREAPAPGEPVYRVRFTRVGQGRGSYVRADSLVNGISYEYLGPGMGDYEPVRILPKPKEQRLVDFTVAVEPLAGMEFFGEWAGSLHDENRLSLLDSHDDRGKAYNFGTRLKPTVIPGLGTFSAQYTRRVVDERFEAFDRIRPVEFSRQWNLASRAGERDVPAGETTHEASIDLALSARTSISGDWGQIAMNSGFSGTRQGAHLHVEEAGLPSLDYRVELIQSRDSLVGEVGTWVRQIGVVQYKLLQDRLVPQIRFEQEQRKQVVLGTDSLARTSMGFTAIRPGVSWRTEQLETGGGVEIRREHEWANGALRDAGTELTVQSHIKYNPGRTFNSDANLGVRMRRFNDYFQVHQGREDTESLILGWNSRAIPFNRAIEATWHYEALTERTPLLQEIYLQTRPEMGQYVWEDANGDGIIQVDEFLPERTPNEGTYIKTFIPSDSLVSVIGVQAKLRLNLDPARVWKEAPTSWKRMLAKVSTRSTIEVTEKSRDQHLAQIYLLNLSRFLNPGTTLNGRIRLAQELYLFRNEPRFGIDFSFNHVEGFSELSSGAESRLLRTYTVDSRYRPYDQWGVKLKAGFERNRTFSELYASRRYDIRSISVHPEASFTISQRMHAAGGIAYSRKHEVLGDRTVGLIRAPLELRYGEVQRFLVTARMEFAHAFISDEAVGMALYELTEGRGPGRSLLWMLNGQCAINSYLRASITYDGRAPSDAPVLHMLRLQMSATF